MDKVDRYLRLVGWARKRYTSADGMLAIKARGEPSAFTRIEHAAFNRYLA